LNVHIRAPYVVRGAYRVPCMRRYDGNKKAIVDIGDRKTACSEAVRRAAGGGLSELDGQVSPELRMEVR
ncbi:hypothetical protein, partial [Burkholderia pseudomallei]